MIKWGYRVEKFPMIIGQDAAGEVVSVGNEVTHVQKGSRVIA